MIKEAMRLASTYESDPKRRQDWERNVRAELRRLHEENTALRKCAIKYLDYLRIPNQEKALESDIKNKDMLK